MNDNYNKLTALQKHEQYVDANTVSDAQIQKLINTLHSQGMSSYGGTFINSFDNEPKSNLQSLKEAKTINDKKKRLENKYVKSSPMKRVNTILPQSFGVINKMKLRQWEGQLDYSNPIRSADPDDNKTFNYLQKREEYRKQTMKTALDHSRMAIKSLWTTFKKYTRF